MEKSKNKENIYNCQYSKTESDYRQHTDDTGIYQTWI